MDLNELFVKIRPCDMDRPYAFISYCSKDSNVVWRDVYYLQNLGYNIWIDKNLKETDNSWKKGAMEAIENIECKLVIFYLSESSVTSVPCLEELKCRESRETCNNHGGESIPWIAVEVNPIQNISIFRKEVFQKISSNLGIAREKKNTMASTMSQLMDDFFPDENKVRIKSKNDDSKRYDYYLKIEENFMQSKVAKFSDEDIYETSLSMLNNAAFDLTAMDMLQWCADEKKYLPAILMLAFINETGACGKKEHEKAQSYLMWGSFWEKENNWKVKGAEYKRKQMYEEAAAFYSAHGIQNASEEGFLEAAKMWMKMKPAHFLFTKKCAEEAAKLGSEEGKKLFGALRHMKETEFAERMKKIEDRR